MAAAEFTAEELTDIRELLLQRYRGEVEIHLADSELRLAEADPLTAHPTVYWHQRDANFVVFKLGARRYRAQFFYAPTEQFGTGIDEYNDLRQCVAAVLQTQADHERARADMTPTRENSSAAYAEQ